MKFAPLILLLFLARCGGSTSAKPTPSAVPPSIVPPTATPDTTAYRLEVAALVLDYRKQFADFSGLAENPNFDSATWKMSILNSLQVIKETNSKLRAVKVPDCAAARYQLLLKAVSSLDEALDRLSAAITARDGAQIRTVGPAMAASQQNINTALDTLNQGC